MRTIVSVILAVVFAAATPVVAQEPTTEIRIKIRTASRDHTLILCEYLRSQLARGASGTPWTLKRCGSVAFAMMMRSLESGRTEEARREARTAADQARVDALNLQYPDQP